MDDVRVESLDEARVHIASLRVRVDELERRMTVADKKFDTFVDTPAWKRWLFILDGWSGHKLQRDPAWRPWRRWWRS